MDIAVGKVTAYKDPQLPAQPKVSGGPDWIAVLKKIPPPDAEILLMAVRTMYPHDGLDETIYRRVIVRFDSVAAGNAAAAAMLAVFCEMLGAVGPVGFLELSESYRVAALQGIEATPAFFFVQRLAVRYLYDDVEVWAAFGYEGASVHLGGYALRGFDDLDWLPVPPNDI